MALYLNNAQYGSSNQSSQDTLIHSYNKSFFSDYNQAKSVLLQKVMKPGEVTFAYYYDPKTPYGQNTIFAVGPLSAAGCNTIFKNADEIDSVKDVLDETIADINASVSNMETKVDGIIKEKNSLLEKIEKNINDIDQLKGRVKDINTSISNIIENIDNIKVQTDTSGGTIQNKFDQISSQLLNISEHLLKIDSSINNLETKIAENETYHD